MNNFNGSFDTAMVQWENNVTADNIDEVNVQNIWVERESSFESRESYEASAEILLLWTLSGPSVVTAIRLGLMYL